MRYFTICKFKERSERLGQKCLTPRNKKKLMKIAFLIFVYFGLFLGVASAPIVYSFLKNETEVFLTFVPRSFFFEISEDPDFWTFVYSRVCSKPDS
ncbi:hypothetical protein P7H50_09040 [Enterococcus durans]|nr:hypothetical protein [Enterococcus durans]